MTLSTTILSTSDVLLSSSDDDSDYEDYQLSDFDDWACLFMIVLASSTPKSARSSYWIHKRLNWDNCVAKLFHKNRFHVRYRMPLENFTYVVGLLKEHIEPNWVMSSRQCEHPIISEVVVAIGLRYLTGDSYDDIMHVYGMSKTGFYKFRNKLLEAVLHCQELSLQLPSTPEEWESIRRGFAKNSTNGIMWRCVGAVDSLLQPGVITPRLKECKNNP